MKFSIYFRPAWWWSSTVNRLDKEQNSRTHLQIVILENWPWNSSLWISTSKNSLIFQLSLCWPYATPMQLYTEVARETHSWHLSVLHSTEKEQLRTSCTASLVLLHVGTTLAVTYKIKRCRARPECMVSCLTWSNFSRAEASRQSMVMDTGSCLSGFVAVQEGLRYWTFALAGKGNNNSKDQVITGFSAASHKQSYTLEYILRLHQLLRCFSLLLMLNWCGWRLKSLSTHAADLEHIS